VNNFDLRYKSDAIKMRGIENSNCDSRTKKKEEINKAILEIILEFLAFDFN
jgi:hypothetical protein